MRTQSESCPRGKRKLITWLYLQPNSGDEIRGTPIEPAGANERPIQCSHVESAGSCCSAGRLEGGGKCHPTAVFIALMIHVFVSNVVTCRPEQPFSLTCPLPPAVFAARFILIDFVLLGSDCQSAQTGSRATTKVGQSGQEQFECCSRRFGW